MYPAFPRIIFIPPLNSFCFSMKHLPEIEVCDIGIAGREVHKVYIRK